MLAGGRRWLSILQVSGEPGGLIAIGCGLHVISQAVYAFDTFMVCLPSKFWDYQDCSFFDIR